MRNDKRNKTTNCIGCCLLSDMSRMYFGTTYTATESSSGPPLSICLASHSVQLIHTYKAHACRPGAFTAETTRLQGESQLEPVVYIPIFMYASVVDYWWNLSFQGSLPSCLVACACSLIQ